ncbi:DUF4399 domain-containing protein [bacterium]|nr:DUF4399 domain-containing protein [bacterium]
MKKIYFILFSIVILTACNDNNSTSGDESSDTDSTNTEMTDGADETFEGEVFFKNIKNGDTLKSPFLMEMGVTGMTVEPKGPVKPGYGHHHLLINDKFADKGMIIVADSTHIHYGGGQVSDSVDLAPGIYKLTLQFADGQHVSYGEEWSKSINVTVVE